MIEQLIKMANKLDKEGNVKGASLIDAVIEKLAEEDDFESLFGDPAAEEELPGEVNPFEGDSRYEAGGLEADVIPLDADEGLGEKNMFEEFISFIMALADGAYTDIKEAVSDAESLLESLDESEGREEDIREEIMTEVGEEGEIGKVLEFPTPE
jgi:hypothetical protein